MKPKLAEFLQHHRTEIVRREEVLEQRYDPTYGLQDPSTKTIEVIDFDALCDAIDEFQRTLTQEK